MPENRTGSTRNTKSSATCVGDKEVRRLIRQAAHRVVRRTAMTTSDIPDLEQTFALSILTATPAFDPQRGTWHAFARQVIRRSENNQLRGRFAEKRDPRRKASLHQEVKVEDGVYTELAQQITYEDLDARTGNLTRDPADEATLQLDLEAFVECLPEPLRQLALDLMMGTKSEVSRMRGTPRTTIQSRVRRLRQLAEDQGLQIYVER